jgi:hypothetical protein
MIETVLLFILIAFISVIALHISLRHNAKHKPLLYIAGIIILLSIVAIFITRGTDKFNKELSRIIKNSKPNSAEEVYGLLFKKPADNCLNVINFKDQVIPKIDCCIWTELNICPKELMRIIKLKKYQESILRRSDSATFLQSFSDRPAWWRPQNLGDSLTKLNIIFNEDNEQSLFFGKDSIHIYLCDKAL